MDSAWNPVADLEEFAEMVDLNQCDSASRVEDTDRNRKSSANLSSPDAGGPGVVEVIKGWRVPSRRSASATDPSPALGKLRRPVEGLVCAFPRKGQTVSPQSSVLEPTSSA